MDVTSKNIPIMFVFYCSHRGDLVSLLFNVARQRMGTAGFLRNLLSVSGPISRGRSQFKVHTDRRVHRHDNSDNGQLSRNSPG
jgi:hypothetical protein